MERTLSIPIGIIVARTTIHSAWADHRWRCVAIVHGSLPLSPGSLMSRDGESACFFAGNSTLDLHATETDSYRINTEQDVPRVYVVLRRSDGQHDTQPPYVHLVTAAPDETEAYLEGDDGVVDGLPMPRALREVLTAFIAAHHTEAPPAARTAKLRKSDKQADKRTSQQKGQWR